MDLTSRNFFEFIQDPSVAIALLVVVVLALMILSFVLGLLLGRIGSRTETRNPDQGNISSKATPVKLNYIVPAPASPLSELVQDLNLRPAVPEPHSGIVPLLPTEAVDSATPLPPVVPEPAAGSLPPAAAAPTEPVLGTSGSAQILTRTGANPTQEKLHDPYSISERLWSKAESARAIALYGSGKSIVAIAQVMKIDMKQVAIHLIRTLFEFSGEINDVSAAPHDGWQYTDEDASKMVSYFDAGASIQEIATALERTVLGVGWRMLDRKMV